jgi:hypothetical protein
MHLKTSIIAFICGYTPAFISGFAIPSALTDAVSKIIVAAIVGFVGGYAGLLGKDYYEKRKAKKDGNT